MKTMVLNRPWVILLVALLFVAVLLILGYESFRDTEQDAFDEFNQRQLVLAKEAADGIELYFETLVGELRARAERHEVQHLEEISTQQELEHLFDAVGPLGVNAVAVLDAEGIVRYNVATPELEDAALFWRQYYQEAQEAASSDTYLIEFVEVQGVEAGEKGILVAVPMFQTTASDAHPAPSGEFAGVAVATLKLDTLMQEFVVPIQSSPRGHAFLVDSEYHVLWAPDRSLLGQDLLEESEEFPSFQQMVQEMGDGDSGMAEYTYRRFDESTGAYAHDEQEEKLIAYAPVMLGDDAWAVGVWAPQDDARQGIWSAHRGQLIVVGLSISIILLAALYSVAVASRTSRFLEQEVDAKTKELRESHERLRSAWEELEAAHSFQQSIMDSVAEPIMVVGTDYQVRMMNRAARNFSQGDAATSESLYCYQVSHLGHAPCKGTDHPCPMEAVRESEQAVTVVHEHRHADGERRLVEVLASPLWGTDGSLQGIIEALRDITERIRAEEALQQYAERLRALATQLAEVSEAEQQRLARELHDQVGQNLTALGINLNIIHTQMPTEAKTSVLSYLEDSMALVEQTTERIRSVMADLRPPVLDDYGLVAALHWYGEQFSKRTNIAVAVKGKDPMLRHPARVESALFRIAQEALTNVAKHAQATQVTVTVEADDTTIRLSVVDDGVGFDPDHLATPDGGGGWGLLTMRERAEALGGRFQIESVPGEGVQATVEVYR